MAMIKTDDQHYKDIAAKIREKTGSDTEYKPSEMGVGVGDVYDAGYAAGQKAGGSDSYYDEFWDAYQNNGTRTSYYQLFVQSGWNDTTFNPKYPITCSGTQSYHVTNASQIFYNCFITEINTPIVVSDLPMTQTFYNCTKLKKIADLTLDGVTEFSQCFSYCKALVDVIVHGSIDVNFSISASAVLSRASIENIMSVLSDTATGQTVSFNRIAVEAAFTTDEWNTLVATKSNWTIALV